MGAEEGGVGGMSGVWLGVRRGCVCGCVEGVAVGGEGVRVRREGCAWGCIEVWLGRVGGVAGGAWERLGGGWGGLGAAGVWLGAHRGVVGERLRASGAQMGPKPYVFTGGTEVLCFHRRDRSPMSSQVGRSLSGNG